VGVLFLPHSYSPLVHIMDYAKLVRNLRRHDLLFDSADDHKIHRILRKALTLQAKRFEQKKASVGRYSGLTKRELAQSGTCETDWF
jgi:hypothetical protein